MPDQQVWADGRRQSLHALLAYQHWTLLSAVRTPTARPGTGLLPPAGHRPRGVPDARLTSPTRPLPGTRPSRPAHRPADPTSRRGDGLPGAMVHPHQGHARTVTDRGIETGVR
ncbi:hypothetical protein ACQ4WX_47395 [Streptomyces lasalocidi]